MILNTQQAGFDFTDSRRISRLVSTKSDPHRIIASQVGPEYWNYRRRWDLARSFKLKLPFPLHVDYELLFACNLRCPICLMSLPGKDRLSFGDPGQRLAFETVAKLLDEGAAHGQAAVGLNGICEPLLSPELPEIIRFARSAGMLDVMFNTNGLLLDEPVSRELIRSGLTRIMISLDAATAGTYRRIRVGSDFDRVTENVRRFVRLRREMGSVLPVVRLSFCLTSLNEHELDDFLETWTDVVDFFSIQRYGNTFEGKYADERGQLFPVRRADEAEMPRRCAQPWKRVMVRHNGDVLPCCDASGLSLVIGNLNVSSLAEIWRSAEAERIRNMHKKGLFADEPICLKCMTKWGPSMKGAGQEAYTGE